MLSIEKKMVELSVFSQACPNLPKIAGSFIIIDLHEDVKLA